MRKAEGGRAGAASHHHPRNNIYHIPRRSAFRHQKKKTKKNL